MASPTIGATTLFTSYEAEAGTIGGGAQVISLTTPPTNRYSSPVLEASGHAYVQLTGTGHFVQWANNTGNNITAINLRACVPDSSDGRGLNATLNLYINDVFRQSLLLTSKQTWLYEGGTDAGGNSNYQGNNQNPADGFPRVFFDDMRTFITGDAMTPGSTFKLQKDTVNTAAFYYIDVIDVEAPPPALTQPADSLSITTYGAVANSIGVDSTSAIQNCLTAAQSQGKSVWIPQGKFFLNGTSGLSATGMTIQGAGMWYSTVHRNVPLPNPNPLGALFQITSCVVKNFACDSNATSRAVIDGCGGSMDITGTNWLVDSIWTQHTMSGIWASGSGGTVQNCRLTSIWADGCNVNNVSLTGTVGNNLTVRNNFIRGTGDDALAINSVKFNDGSPPTFYTTMNDAIVVNNTSIAPWGGKGLGIYGGAGHLVQNNYMSDTARFIGLGVMKFGVNGSDLTSGTVTGNLVVRCGGNGFDEGQPALQIGNGGDGQKVGIVENVIVTENTVANALYDGVGFSQSENITLQSTLITSPGRNGIVVQPHPAFLAPDGSATIQANTVTGLAVGMSPFVNNSTGFVANVSGNNWQIPSTRLLLPGTNISLKAQANNMFVSSDNAGASPLIANRTTAGGWETFSVIDAGNSAVGLRSGANALYVSPDNRGSSPLIANRAAIGPWESFSEIDAGSGNRALLSHANSMYVSAANAGNDPLIANRSAIGSWESFVVATI